MDDVSPQVAGAATGRPSLPHNLEAEQFLLGAILLDNELIERVDGFLRPEHFYDPVHRRIYEVCKRNIDRGLLADPVVLKSHFSSEGTLRELGGEAYLAQLAQSVPSLAAITDYGRAIFQAFQRRGLIGIGNEIVASALNEDVDNPPTEQISTAEQNLYGLAEIGRFGGGFRSFKESAAKALEIAALAYKREGHVSGVATHLRDLDRRLGGLQPSDLVILAGRPGMGKTALATNIAFNVANARRKGGPQDGGIVAFFSLEMSCEQLAQRIISGEAGIPSDRVRRGDIEMHDYDSLASAMQTLQETPLYIDDTGALSIAALAARARRLKRTFNELGLVVIDYVQLMTASGRKKTDNRVQEITEITQGLKALAKELNVPIIALSQLSRAVEQRDDKRPQLSDLRESGSIEQDADIVLFVFRESYYLGKKPEEDGPELEKWMSENERVHGKAEVIIAKQRHGPTGTVDLHFNGMLTKFSDLASSEDAGRYL